MTNQDSKSKFDCNCGYAQGIAHWHSPKCNIFGHTSTPTTEKDESGDKFFKFDLADGGELRVYGEKWAIKRENPPKTDWEEKFDEKFGGAIKWVADISNLLSQTRKEERERVVETVEGMKRRDADSSMSEKVLYRNAGFNQALEDIKTKLKEEISGKI